MTMSEAVEFIEQAFEDEGDEFLTRVWLAKETDMKLSEFIEKTKENARNLAKGKETLELEGQETIDRLMQGFELKGGNA